MEKTSLEGLLRQYTDSAKNKMYTSMPAIIVGIPDDLEDQRVEIQLLIDRVDTSGQNITIPRIINVPLMYPSSRSSSLTFPLSIGDGVLAVFSQRSLDRLKMSSGAIPLPPKNYRKYSRNDAIAIPGFFTFSEAINNPSKHTLAHNTRDMVMVHNIGTGQEAEVRIKPDGNIVVTSPSEVIVNSPKTTINGDTQFNGNVSVNGNFASSSGAFTHNGKNVGSTHTHGGVETGNGTTSVPS